MLIFVWAQPKIARYLTFDGLKQPMPGLHQMVVRVPPVVPEPAPEDAIADLNILSLPGTAVFLGAVLAALILGMSPARIARTFGRTVIHLMPSLLAISFMVGLAYVTRYSGMDTVLGLSLTRTGPAFPFFGTLLGWLGVALTGTDAGSNALFGNLQKVTAERLGISPILMASANSSGGVMGKMIDCAVDRRLEHRDPPGGPGSGDLPVRLQAQHRAGLPGRRDRDAVCLRVPRDHPRGDAGQVGRLERIRADDLLAGAGPDRPPGLEVDRILDELHRAVAEGDVDAAGMVARRRDRRSDPAPGRIRDIGGRIRSAGAGDAVGRHDSGCRRYSRSRSPHSRATGLRNCRQTSHASSPARPCRRSTKA